MTDGMNKIIFQQKKVLFCTYLPGDKMKRWKKENCLLKIIA